MPYIIEVDLSAKVEQWSKNTAVAFSDGIRGSILIESSIKRAARDWLRAWYPNRSKAFYRYSLLAAFVYLLIKPHLQQIEHVVIDKDYPGEKNEGVIKDFLLSLLHREDPSLRGGFISFWEVGGSAADTLARRVYLGDEEADRKISFKDIQQLFK